MGTLPVMAAAALLSLLDPPAPAPPDVPLPEIGRVRASICTAIVKQSDAAIEHALNTNRGLAMLGRTLRATDLEKLDDQRRRKGIDALIRLVGSVRSSTSDTTAEVARLHQLAGSTRDPQRAVALNAFADALAGAVERQRRAAAYVDESLVRLESSTDIADANITKAEGVGGAAPAWMIVAGIDPVTKAKKADDNARAWDHRLASIAMQFEGFFPDIAHDEDSAASHKGSMLSGC